MKSNAKGISRHLRISGILLILGLAIEALSLMWGKPLAFLLFICIGGMFVLAGILVYLYALVSVTAFTTHQD
jgi:hypothetical protein